MKAKLTSQILSIIMIVGILTACGGNNDQQMNNQPEDVNYDPMRYGNNEGEMGRDYMDDRLDDDNRTNENRGPDMGADPRDGQDMRNNMDEEVPLDPNRR